MDKSVIHMLPESDRPRERLRRHGAEAISTAELLAIILGSGIKGKSVLELSQDIMTQFGSLEMLAQATLAELSTIKGLGPAKALQLLAAINLGKRLARQQPVERQKIGSPAQAYAAVCDDLVDQKRELFLVVLLDTKGCKICNETVSVGTLSRTLVHPREVFYPAIRHKAARIILAHNHPSGDPTPSYEDVTVTRELIAAGKMMGIPVSDHIIVGKNNFTSLRQNGENFD